ncbi:MAG: hypothetical protein Q9164_004452, partial [Protoblastenia rupestris]
MISSSTTPLLGRSKTTPKRTPVTAGKGKGKANGNIMSFFKKAECNGTPASTADEDDQELFLDSGEQVEDLKTPMQTPTPPHDQSPAETDSHEIYSPPEISPIVRYNEELGSVKRRKIDESKDSSKVRRSSLSSAPPKGPFLDDSEDEGKEPVITPSKTLIEAEESMEPVTLSKPAAEVVSTKLKPTKQDWSDLVIPRLQQESTSAGGVDEFDGVEDFIDDEFPEEGEEYLERRWMEEQAQMELQLEQEQDDDPSNVSAWSKEEKAEDCTTMLPPDAASSVCPICGGNTAGMTEQQASTHVNDCLDGKAPPLPEQREKLYSGLEDQPTKVDNIVPAHKRFQRAAIARP